MTDAADDSRHRSPTRATRRRGAELESAILSAAWDVLVERGYEGLTYEAVAARAHTSRPVLYRRWPQRRNLLIDTLSRFWRPVPVPDTGTLRGDAIAFLHEANSRNSRTVTMLSVQLATYFRETGSSFNELRQALDVEGQTDPFATIIDRAVARGELSGPPGSARVANVAFDLLRHESLLTRAPTPDAVIEEIVDDIWLPLLGA